MEVVLDRLNGKFNLVEIGTPVFSFLFSLVVSNRDNNIFFFDFSSSSDKDTERRVITLVMF